MYSWAGQLYTALRTGCQGIKGTSAGLAGFSGIKNAYRGRKKLLDNGAFFCPRIIGKFFLPTNCTNGHEWLQWIKMATGSVALIYTNAMSSLFTCPVTYCLSSRFSAALGIARTSTVLHSLARKFVQFVGKNISRHSRCTQDNFKLSLAGAIGNELVNP